MAQNLLIHEKKSAKNRVDRKTANPNAFIEQI
jgi:hypothetical protein